MDKPTININGDGNNLAINSKKINQKISTKSKDKNDMWWLYSIIASLITIVLIWWSYASWKYAIFGGVASFIIVWKLNPKFRFRNIGYAILASGLLSNVIHFSGMISIHKNDLIHGIIRIGDNDISILLIVLSVLFFILDHFENKK